MMRRLKCKLLILFVLATSVISAKEYHVAVKGSDSNDGSVSNPFRTINFVAQRAVPGDVIIVHEGIYREWVNPLYGGESNTRRIIYRAAKGEKVVITGSEPVKGWEKVSDDIWKVMLPNSFFGNFNPYSDLIRGDWFDPKGRQHHTGCVYLNGNWMIEAINFDELKKPIDKTPLWFGQVEKETTTIWAQFKGVNPNGEQVEINTRKVVFYPDRNFINYITVSGFTMENAATNWAPPSAEQTGIVGTNWSKGWIIENNTVRNSKCSGISLGKYGDEFDNTNDAGAADPYTACVRRALKNGWNKETVGSHLVRNNHIYNCEQTGIVGSMGCAFSTVTGNEIHDIYVRRLFTGAEMGGIKFHGAIDVKISGNHIYRVGGVAGIWLDWMAQGAQVTGNLLHDNQIDIFCEMQHGPLLIANNIMLSKQRSFLINSKGLAIVHNLILGPIEIINLDERNTPYHLAHSTEIAGLFNAPGGDHRFYNNLFVSACKANVLDKSILKVWAAGNVFTRGTQASKFDREVLVKPEFDTGVRLTEKTNGWYLELAVDPNWTKEQKRRLVTTELLGKAKIPNLSYENADGKPLKIDKDYFGKQRSASSPSCGPFEGLKSGEQTLKVWGE
jgi:alpha-N-arabinofuranosidase